MINSKPLPRRGPLGPHLSQEQLFYLLGGQVLPAEKRKMEMHLHHCPLCAEALEGYVHSDASVAQATLLELNHLIKKRTARRKPNTLLTDVKTWGVATVIVFLILISAAIVWNAVHTSKTPPVTVPTKPILAPLTPYAKPAKGYVHLNTYLKVQQNKLPVSVGQSKGRVILTFTVNPDSSLSGFKVVKSVNKKLDQAAINFIKNGPAWQPASRQGKAVAQKVTLPIVFK